MKFKFNSNFFIALFLAGFLFAACKREKLDLSKIKDDWNPTLAVPLIDTKLGVYNIFAATDSTLLSVNNSGLLSLAYRGELLSIPAGDIVNLPDQSFLDELSLNASESSTLVSNGSVFKTVSTVHDYIPIPTQNTLEIDSLRLLTGSIRLDIANSFSYSGKLVVKMPTIKKGASSFQVEIPLSGPAFSIKKDIDISGYSVGMASPQTSFNQFPIIYELSLTYNNNQPTGTEKIVVRRDLANWKFERFFGYMGQHEIIPGTDSINIEIFKNAYGGYFAATNPKITMEFVNSFGFPIALNLRDMHMRNNISNVKMHLIPSNFPANYAIAHPSMSQIGSSAISKFTIDKSNSNIDSLINSTPKHFVYGFSGKTNPSGKPTGGRNFMTHQSRFTINTEIELPLEGFAYGLGITDTLDFNFSENLEEIDWVEFRITMENRFPVDINIQLIFLDNNFIKLDSLIPTNENIVNSGIVDNSGRVTTSTKKVTLVKFEQERVPNLINAKHVIVRGLANTYQSGSASSPNPIVKFYSDYDLSIKAGVRIKSRPTSGNI